MSTIENHARGEIIRLRRSLIRCQDEARLLRRDLLRRKYNPDQPRVPAGGSGGGQWTSGSGGGGGGMRLPLGGGGGLAEFAPDGGEGFVADETGQEAWASFNETIGEDGLVSQRDITNRDGSTIQSEYAASREAGFDERHTVTLPDGATKVAFETQGQTQTIRYGGPDGEIVSRSLWTPNGPEPDATVQPAFASPFVAPALIAGGAILFNWQSPFNGEDGQQAVMGFRAREFRPGTNATGRFDLGYVGQISESEAEAACRYLPEIQTRLDAAKWAAGELDNYPSAAVYGTAIHQRLKTQIDDLRNPNFRAERSFAKEAAEPTSAAEVRYGYPASVRIDAYESRDDGVICIYDVKTGRQGLVLPRAKELAEYGYLGLRRPARVIVIEVRPNR